MLLPYIWILLTIRGLVGAPEVARAGELVEREAWVMGTRMHVVVEAPTRGAALRATEATLLEVERYDRLLSTWDPDSEIARVNTAPPGIPLSLTPELAGLLEEAEAWAVRSGRRFDPTVGALVDVWDLRGEGRIPTEVDLAEALARTGPEAFALDRRTPAVRRLVPGAWLDTGGFGKGAALRAAARVLKDHGVARALVDLGGQLWAGSEVGEPWPVGIAHPARRHETVAVLEVGGVSVATSGTSERWGEVEGERLGHILDPRTGRPVPAWGSVTVVSPDPLEADVLATALYVMGPDEGMAWALGETDAGVLFAREGDDGLDLTWNEAMERWLAASPAAMVPR